MSGWQTYITGLIDEFFGELSNPTDPTYNSIHTLLKDSFSASKKKFNTPNWENSRELFLLFTGSDPSPSWVWSRRGFNIQQSRDRLNEILKVRHSFAHGLPLPSFAWTTSGSGRAALTNASILDTKAFVNFIVKQTDEFYKSKLKLDFGKSLLNW
ncbi:MAG TPA: hypothetical protein VJ385_23150 [Fibrobacteria bacterium]|nr:hypothetical protein [Fibrobacteria bacterium]